MSSAQDLADKFETGEAEFKEGSKRTKAEQAEHKHSHPEGDTRRALNSMQHGEEKRKEQNLKEQGGQK